MTPPRDPLDRALDAVRAAAPAAPPPVARVWDAVRDDAARRTRRRLTGAVAAGLLVAIGVTAVVTSGGGGGGTRPDGAPTALVLPIGRAAPRDALVVRRDGVVAAAWDGSVEPRDVLEAREAARVTLAAGAAPDLDPGARVVVVSGARVEQPAGRVRYDVDHDPRRPFTVVAAGTEIVDVGTRFVVDVSPEATPGAAPAHGLVTVEAGEVAVGGTRLLAGRGLALRDGRPLGGAWPTDAKPVLRLDVETPNPRAGEPVVCRVTLVNPTDAWLPLPRPDPGSRAGTGGPVWFEVTGPDGAVALVRVTDAQRLPPRTATSIPPRGEAVVRVQFERTFASPGTYRLRAVYRPADAVEPPRSPEALLTVR